jgi:hypothetical protein
LSSVNFVRYVQTGSGANPASCTMGTGGPFPGGKARQGRDADHSPPSSAEVVNEYELYSSPPQAAPWRVEGLLYFTFIIICSTSSFEWEVKLDATCPKILRQVKELYEA